MFESVREFFKCKPGKFNAGDLVDLPSGGPVMTMNRYTETGVECMWFVGSELKFDCFREGALRKVEPYKAPVPQQPVILSKDAFYLASQSDPNCAYGFKVVSIPYPPMTSPTAPNPPVVQPSTVPPVSK